MVFISCLNEKPPTSMSCTVVTEVHLPTEKEFFTQAVRSMFAVKLRKNWPLLVGSSGFSACERGGSSVSHLLFLCATSKSLKETERKKEGGRERGRQRDRWMES